MMDGTMALDRDALMGEVRPYRMEMSIASPRLVAETDVVFDTKIELVEEEPSTVEELLTTVRQSKMLWFTDG